jgi:hypothetical protein
VLRANEARVAVLFQQQSVHVVTGVVEGEAGRCFQFALRPLHRFAVDVDLARRPRSQKLTAKRVLFEYIDTWVDVY